VTEPLRLAFRVACPPEHAFDIWTRRTSLWWPADHTMSGEDGLDVVIEPRVGGRIFERTAAAGRRCCRGSWSSVKEERPMAEGTPESPWRLKTPSGQSEYEAWRDESMDPPAVVVRVGKSELRYHLSALDDLHAMLSGHGDWMLLGSADEQKPAADGTVEAWARSESNPVGGWYGLKKGMRGRFANYVPPILEELGRAEVEHNARNNRMRAR
jgi:hypothetical protein